MAEFNVKEAFAAAGVIGSMIFVGLQIRQNTEAVRGSTIQAISDQSLQFNLALAQDDDWLVLNLKISRDSVAPSDLEPLELNRLNWVLTASTRIMENRFRQRQLGILGDDALGQLGAAASWYGSWWFREWWDQLVPEDRWAPDFVEFMEREVLAPSPP